MSEPAGSWISRSMDSGRLPLKLTNRLRGLREVMLSVRVASSYSTRVFSAALTSAALPGSLGRTSTMVPARLAAARRTSATYRSRVTAMGDGGVEVRAGHPGFLVLGEFHGSNMAPLWHLYKSLWLTMAYRKLIGGAMVCEGGTKRPRR